VPTDSPVDGGEEHRNHRDMPREFRPDDAGSDVFDATGDRIGMVTSVESNMLHIKPGPSLTDRMRQRLGWDDSPEQIAIRRDEVERIEDDRIYLESTIGQ